MNENQPEYPLVSFLQKHSDDRAMLAQLRRGLGRNPGEVAEMFPFVIPFIHNLHQEADAYMIASLFALHPSSVATGNMGNHLRFYAQTVGDDESTTRRFVQLLRMNRDSLEPRLRQHISILKSKDIPVNWHQLMHDIHYWNHGKRFVQKQWASAYWKLSKTNN